MKKLICLVLVILSCLNVAYSYADIDLSDYSQQQLLDLRSAINERLKEISNNNKVLHSDKNMEITWIGLEKNRSLGMATISLMIKNKSKKSLFYEITKIAFNDIQVSYMNDFITEIGAGLSYLTSTSNCSVVNLAPYSSLGINKIEDVDKIYFELSIYKNDSSIKATKKLEFTIELP